METSIEKRTGKPSPQRPITPNQERVGTKITPIKTTTPTRPSSLSSPRRDQELSTSRSHHSPHTPIREQLTPQRKTTAEPNQTPKTSPAVRHPSLEDVLDYSFTNMERSSMPCDYSYAPKNGTTFSARDNKYIHHSSSYAGLGSNYLTPTQRAEKELRRLQKALQDTKENLRKKDVEILHLSSKMAELLLLKNMHISPEEHSASSDAVTVREADPKNSQNVSPIVDVVNIPEIIPCSQPSTTVALQKKLLSQASATDSGNFDDMSSSVHSKDSLLSYGHSVVTNDGTDLTYVDSAESLSGIYLKRIDYLIQEYRESSATQRKTCHSIDVFVQKLAENEARPIELIDDLNKAKEQICDLEKKVENLQCLLAEQEEKQNEMYKFVDEQRQEAERIAKAKKATPIEELMYRLQITHNELADLHAADCRNECGKKHALLTAKEAIALWVLGARKTIYHRLLEAQKNRTHVDPEVTLQFLKSAVYYFLTDKENSQGHLHAIESILEFSEAEKEAIRKARSSAK